MTEPDPIPVGLEQLLAYRHKRTMREIDENTARIRALTARIKEDNRQAVLTSQEAVRRMADLMSGELGKRVTRRSSMPGSGAA